MVQSRGLSLVEVLLAAALLGLVVPFLFQLYPTSLLAIRRGENQLEATELARAALEEFRARPFAALAAGETILPSVSGAGQVEFKRKLTIRQVSSRLVELRSIVEWTVRQKTYQTEHAVYVSKVRP
ncbi:MAG: hypothetical protein AMXMBFR33_01240 [Candidatus Xenobia bacterium]